MTAQELIERDKQELREMKAVEPMNRELGLTSGEIRLFSRLIDAIRFCANSGDLGIKIPEHVITEAALGAMRPVVLHKRKAHAELSPS